MFDKWWVNCSLVDLKSYFKCSQVFFFLKREVSVWTHTYINAKFTTSILYWPSYISLSYEKVSNKVESGDVEGKELLNSVWNELILAYKWQWSFMSKTLSSTSLVSEPSSKRYPLVHKNRLFFFFVLYIVTTILQPISKFNDMIIQFFIRPSQYGLITHGQGSPPLLLNQFASVIKPWENCVSDII